MSEIDTAIELLVMKVGLSMALIRFGRTDPAGTAAIIDQLEADLIATAKNAVIPPSIADDTSQAAISGAVAAVQEKFAEARRHILRTEGPD